MQNQSVNTIGPAVPINVPAEDEEFLRQYDIKLSNRGLSVVKEAWRIKLKSNNQFITLGSGKSLWSKIGHAKAALRNDFPSREEAAFQKFITEYVEFVKIS
jgi:thiamine biosynthesis lipoprotein ApbE